VLSIVISTMLVMELPSDRVEDFIDERRIVTVAGKRHDNADTILTVDLTCTRESVEHQGRFRHKVRHLVDVRGVTELGSDSEDCYAADVSSTSRLLVHEAFIPYQSNRLNR